VGLFEGWHFVSCCHPWEAKTKAEKNRRKRPNRSPNPNPAKGARCSLRPRRNKAAAGYLVHCADNHACTKALPAGGLLCARTKCI
jgi:hypothetical protein